MIEATLKDRVRAVINSVVGATTEDRGLQYERLMSIEGAEALYERLDKVPGGFPRTGAEMRAHKAPYLLSRHIASVAGDLWGELKALTPPGKSVIATNDILAQVSLLVHLEQTIDLYHATANRTTYSDFSEFVNRHLTKRVQTPPPKPHFGGRDNKRDIYKRK